MCASINDCLKLHEVISLSLIAQLATNKTEEAQGNGGSQSQEADPTMTGNESQPLAQSDGEERAGAVGLDENGKCEDMKLSLSSTDSDLVGGSP